MPSERGTSADHATSNRLWLLSDAVVEPQMNIFEPVFLLLVLTTLLTLVASVGMALSGKRAKAARLLRRLAIGALAYFAVVILTTAIQPSREFSAGEPQCFDDWCVTVLGGARNAGTPSRYDVSLRLSNRGRRRPMGEKGTEAYLVDERGRRLDVAAGGAGVPFDTILQPGTSIDSIMSFDVPADVRPLGLVYHHANGFPIGWFIISEGGWFSRPPVMLIEQK